MMVNWLKEHKFYLMVSLVLVLLLSYSFFSNLFHGNEVITEEEWIVADEKEFSRSEEEMKESEEPIVMMADIKGSVVQPGVYQVGEGERIIDLVEKAGGLTDEADSSAVNFAMKVSDEMAVYIPSQGEEMPIAVANGELESVGKDKKINLNTATSTELESLPGIGAVKSAAIIDYREKNGPFKDKEEIKSISGIGDKTYEKLEELIKIK